MNEAEDQRAQAEIRRLVEKDLDAGLRRFREREPAIRLGSAGSASNRRSPSPFGARTLVAGGLLSLAVIAGSIWLLRGARAPVVSPSPIAEALADLPGVRAIAATGSGPGPEGSAANRLAPPGPLAEIFGRFAASAPPSAADADLARLEATPRLGLELMFKILYEDRAVERALRRFGRQG